MFDIEWWNPFNGTKGLKKKHIYHVSWITTVLFILAIILSSFYAGKHYHFSGGFKPPKKSLPMETTTLSGYIPPSYSLARYSVRIHNQGDSNSCVGQTSATMMEIYNKEREARDRTRITDSYFSSGFLWNQATNYQNNGTTYESVFGLWKSEGISPLVNFYPDGATEWWIQPWAASYQAASRFKAVSWGGINLSDRPTIEYEISHGSPLAFALDARDSFVNHWADCHPLAYNTGNAWFWHSTTIIAYNAYGVEIQNSWGTAWGCNGRLWFSWDGLAQSGGFLAVVNYPLPHWKPVHKTVKKPVKKVVKKPVKKVIKKVTKKHHKHHKHGKGHGVSPVHKATGHRRHHR